MLSVNRFSQVNLKHNKNNNLPLKKNNHVPLSQNSNQISFNAHTEKNSLMIAKAFILGCFISGLGNVVAKQIPSVKINKEPDITELTEKDQNSSVSSISIDELPLLPSISTVKKSTEIETATAKSNEKKAYTEDQLKKIEIAANGDKRIKGLLLELGQINFSEKDLAIADKLMGAPMHIRSGAESLNYILQVGAPVKFKNIGKGSALTCTEVDRECTMMGEIIIDGSSYEEGNKTNKTAVVAVLGHESGHLPLPGKDNADNSLTQELHNFVLSALIAKSSIDQFGNESEWRQLAREQNDLGVYNDTVALLSKNPDKSEFLEQFYASYQRENLALEDNVYKAPFDVNDPEALKQALAQPQPPILAQLMVLMKDNN